MDNDTNLPHQKHDIRPEDINEHIQEPPPNLHCDIHTKAEKLREIKNGTSINLTPKMEDDIRSTRIKEEKLIKCQSFQIPKESSPKKRSFFSKLFKKN